MTHMDFRLSNSFFTNIFDNELYGKCNQENISEEFMFPAAVLIMEKVQIQDPGYGIRGNTVTSLPGIPEWNTCCYIKFLAAKADLSPNVQTECLKFLLRQVMTKNPLLSYLAATRLDPKHFKKRTSYELTEIPSSIKNYYHEFGTPEWLNEQAMKSVQKQSSIVPTDAQLFSGRVKSLETQRKHKQTQRFKKYSNTEDVMKIYDEFKFSHSSLQNPDVSVDQDDPMELDYDAQMVVWNCQQGTHNLPYLELSNHPIIAVNNRKIYTIKYTEYDAINNLRDKPGAFSLETAYRLGYYEGFNYFWRWTYVPKFMLEQEGMEHFPFLFIIFYITSLF